MSRPLSRGDVGAVGDVAEALPGAIRVAPQVPQSAVVADRDHVPRGARTVRGQRRSRSERNSVARDGAQALNHPAPVNRPGRNAASPLRWTPATVMSCRDDAAAAVSAQSRPQGRARAGHRNCPHAAQNQAICTRGQDGRRNRAESARNYLPGLACRPVTLGYPESDHQHPEVGVPGCPCRLARQVKGLLR
jgi:hypothetical protein